MPDFARPAQGFRGDRYQPEAGGRGKAVASAGSPSATTKAKAAALDRMKALRAEGLGFDRMAARSNEDTF
jgi:hypothetical protein